MNQNSTSTTSEDAELQRWQHDFAVWSKYEDIAMHFNDLAMRFRLQALAGVGAATAAAGSILSHAGILAVRPLGYFLLALSVIWIGLWVMAVYYYQALLIGAVKAILQREKDAPWKRPGETGLSSAIEHQVRRTWPSDNAVAGQKRRPTISGRGARTLFFISVLLPLGFGGLTLSFCSTSNVVLFAPASPAIAPVPPSAAPAPVNSASNSSAHSTIDAADAGITPAPVPDR